MFQLFLMIRHGLLIERLALGLQSSSEIVGSCSPPTGTEFRVASSPWWSSAMFWNHHSTEWPCCQHAKQFGTLENGLVQQWGRPLKSTRESSRMYLIFRRTEMESRISDAAIQSLEGAPWISEKVWKVWLITLAINVFFIVFESPYFLDMAWVEIAHHMNLRRSGRKAECFYLMRRIRSVILTYRYIKSAPLEICIGACQPASRVLIGLSWLTWTKWTAGVYWSRSGH